MVKKTVLSSNSNKKKLSKLILGIDPGKDGALVLLKNGKLFKMLVVPKIKGRRKTAHPNYDAVDSFLKKYRKRIEHAWLERPNTGGSFSGRTQTLSLGDTIGTFRTMLESNKIRHTLIPRPTTWQKIMFEGVPVLDFKVTKQSKTGKNKGKHKQVAVKDNKAMALVAVKRLFPKKNFVPEGCKKEHDGLVDAALIALYGHWKITKGEKK